MARILLAHGEVTALSPVAMYRIDVMTGHVWLSHEGHDALLHAGDSWRVPMHSQECIVIEALRGDAQYVLLGSPQVARQPRKRKKKPWLLLLR